MAGIETLLTRITGLKGIAELFAAIGYDRHLAPFTDGAYTVARWQNFRVAAVTSNNPAQTARSLAITLGRMGERGMALSLSHERLFLAAPKLGSNSATKAFGVCLAQPSGEQIDLISALRPDPQASALSHALRVMELLGTEAAGERFFRTFEGVLETMSETLDKRHRREDRRQVTLLALTRILFLYFVQAKGWLNGEQRFLRRHLDRALASAEPYHKTVLDPLFFGTLNRPVPQRSITRFHDVPYLNGGLFETHPIERRIRPRHFTNESWRIAFDTLFERFRFCVREADEVDAIAPDMLGRVFERLMESEQRASNGAYYTPENLVRQVVRAAIDTARPAGSDHLSALRAIRILDPACGSGAFLLGALNYLVELWEQKSRDGESRSTLRRRILHENLFGVDIDPMAIRLAELRLWLAIIADDTEKRIRDVAPLPNLDGIVRQGDALMDPVSAARAFATSVLPTSGAPKLEQRRLSIFYARGANYRLIAAELRSQEMAFARTLLDRSKRACTRRMHELDVLEQTPDLFGERQPLNREQRRVRRGLVATMDQIERAADVLVSGRVPFFSFEVHAPQPMRQGGFDVVLGNPPWVRAERLSPDMRKALQQRFRWWQSSGRRGYGHLPDLSLAFIERGLELTRPGGVLALLVPSKIASSGYGETARQALVRETTIEYLHRVPVEESARFRATTYPLAVVVRRVRPRADHRVALSFANRATLKQEALRSAGPWIMLPDHDRQAIGSFLEAAEPLSSVVNAALGIKTGADGVFVGIAAQRRGKLTRVQFGAAEAWLEGHHLRPVVRGRDVKPFAVNPSRVMVWPCTARGTAAASLAELTQAYLAAHARTLRARVDYRNGPFWRVFRTAAACAPHRVVWPDLALRPRAVYLEGAGSSRVLPLNTCYCAAVPSQAVGYLVTAVLNSTWVVPFVQAAADEARGGYRRLNGRVMDRIPIPGTRDPDATLIALSENAHSGRHAHQDELDEAVASALDLSASTQSRLRQLAAVSPH